MSTAIVYLTHLCHRWGGSLELLPEPEFRAITQCSGRSVHPSRSHAIDRGARTIFAVRSAANPGTIIHEMGHVFLEEGSPFFTYEPDWLGWEIALARLARCFRTWSKQNIGYLLDSDDEDVTWGALSRRAERELIAERLDHAMALGIVSQDGAPLCTRRPS